MSNFLQSGSSSIWVLAYDLQPIIDESWIFPNSDNPSNYLPKFETKYTFNVGKLGLETVFSVKLFYNVKTINCKIYFLATIKIQSIICKQYVGGHNNKNWEQLSPTL